VQAEDHQLQAHQQARNSHQTWPTPAAFVRLWKNSSVPLLSYQLILVKSRSMQADRSKEEKRLRLATHAKTVAMHGEVATPDHSTANEDFSRQAP
jgi:hypothetical protein